MLIVIVLGFKRSLNFGTPCISHPPDRSSWPGGTCMYKGGAMPSFSADIVLVIVAIVVIRLAVVVAVVVAILVVVVV